MKLTVKTLKGELIELEVELNNTVPTLFTLGSRPKNQNQRPKGIRSRLTKNSLQGKGHHKHRLTR
jgi:hypothetical protein